GEGAVHVRLHNAADRPDAEGIIAAALGTPVVPDADPMALSARADDHGKVADALAGLHRAGIDVASCSLGQPSLDQGVLALPGQPSLDEVFLALTGRPAELESSDDAPADRTAGAADGEDAA